MVRSEITWPLIVLKLGMFCVFGFLLGGLGVRNYTLSFITENMVWLVLAHVRV